MTSRDVHPLASTCPAFRIKQDVLPGRYTETWFEATKPGRYQILCAEYCGTGHSKMLGRGRGACAPEDFDELARRSSSARPGRAAQDARRTTDAGAARAARMVEQGQQARRRRRAASSCHSLDGAPHIGPTWLDLYQPRRRRCTTAQTIVADEAYLTESMMDPRAQDRRRLRARDADATRASCSGPEAAALVEFIKSLRSAERPRPAPPRDAAYEPIQSTAARAPSPGRAHATTTARTT